MSTTLRFLLASKRDDFGDPGLRVTLHPVYLVEDGTVRNPSFHSYRDDPFPELDGFQIGARYAESFGWYGWDAEFYDAYRVDLHRAESMVKVLRALQRKLAAEDKAYGSPPDFPTYCARVAKAVGAKLDGATFGLTSPHGEHIWSSGERYRWTDVDSLRFRLNDLVAKFQKGVSA